MSEGEPKPNRRNAWRQALGGLMLLGCLLANLWLIERAGWTDFRGWWQRAVVQLRGGSNALREKVRMGMTREEVKQILWGEPEQPWSNVVVSIRVPDGESGPLPRYLDYPCPFARVEYPEYGFNVVYHGQDLSNQDDWTVVGVEDRE
jgi:hypothetical protein